jgi:hypothetical protein
MHYTYKHIYTNPTYTNIYTQFLHTQTYVPELGLPGGVKGPGTLSLNSRESAYVRSGKALMCWVWVCAACHLSESESLCPYVWFWVWLAPSTIWSNCAAYRLSDSESMFMLWFWIWVWCAPYLCIWLYGWILSESEFMRVLNLSESESLCDPLVRGKEGADEMRSTSLLP